MIAIYHQTKTLINFWCKQGLNFKSLIQLLETLSVELTGTNYSVLCKCQSCVKLVVVVAELVRNVSLECSLRVETQANYLTPSSKARRGTILPNMRVAIMCARF